MNAENVNNHRDNNLSFGDLCRAVLPAIILIPMLVVILNTCLYRGFVPSESMIHTIEPGDITYGWRLSYKKDIPERGDIICFPHGEVYLVKRVVGLPGDVVTLDDGKVYVNGDLLPEPYVIGETHAGLNGSTFVVPEGCVFPMGDNREASTDARYWANPYVPISDIQCKIFLIQHGIFSWDFV